MEEHELENHEHEHDLETPVGRVHAAMAEIRAVREHFHETDEHAGRLDSALEHLEAAHTMHEVTPAG